MKKHPTAKELAQNTKIEKLDIGINDEGAKALANNTTLTMLDIRSNLFKTKETKEEAEKNEKKNDLDKSPHSPK